MLSLQRRNMQRSPLPYQSRQNFPRLLLPVLLANLPAMHPTCQVDTLEAAFSSQDSCCANNVRLDDALTALSQLSQQVAGLTGDLEMMKARTIGDRRS